MEQVESMLRDADDQTWLVDAGHIVIEKKRTAGIDALTPRERLILCFWAADYSMRNAGDLTAARALDPGYRSAGLTAARALLLPRMAAAFAMSEGELERRYFDLFDDLCAELRAR